MSDHVSARRLMLCRRRIAGHRRAVDRAHARADHEVGHDVVLEQCAQHPDLARPELAAAPEHERIHARGRYLSSRASRRRAAGTGTRPSAGPASRSGSATAARSGSVRVIRTSTRAVAAQHRVAERPVQVLVGAPDRAPERLERAAAAGAGDRDPRPAREAARHQRLVAGAAADLRPAVGERAEHRRVGLDARVAVLVDAVADHLARAGPDRRVAVVAVLRAGDAVAVAVEVGGVGAVAVLVDAVVGDVGRARPQARVGVVAVGGAADAVEVRVALDLLARAARVGVVGDRRVVAVAAVDVLLGAPVARDDVVVARAAVERVDARAAEQAVVAAAAVERDGDASPTG